MPKVDKKDLTPEQIENAEANAESKEQNAENSDQLPVDSDQHSVESDQVPTTDHSPLTTHQCDHDWTFHMSCQHQSQPGKKTIYDRCTKCNELKVSVVDV